MAFEQSLYTNPWDNADALVMTVLRGNDGVLGPFTVDYTTSDLTAKAGTDYQAVSDTLQFQANETVKTLSIPLLRGRAAAGTNRFQVSLSNPTGGLTLGTTFFAHGDIVGRYITIAPPSDAKLTVWREWGVTVLTCTGGGQLQRADRVTGPWQRLAATNRPFTVQSPLPTTFYRVKRPRPVSLYIPSSYDGGTPLPLVLLIHGYSSSGDLQEAYMQFRPWAEARGFLYCHPEGTTDRLGYQFWNTTEACCDFGNTSIDDAGYLRGLIQEIGRHVAVDRKRVYLIGHSNGAFMSYRMACESADLIAGIAALAGLPFQDPSWCVPTEPVNILHIHGTTDEVAPYAGGALGMSLGFPANRPPFPGALRAIQMWAAYNGASSLVPDPSPTLDLTTDVAGLDTVITRYANAPPGGAVELWTIVGGSHGPALSANFSPYVIDWLLAHPKP